MWRYERKYYLAHLDVQTVRQIIKLHPAAFQKHFPDRQVNNIYFDTPAFQSFLDNQTGILNRKKFRLRWYGQKWDQLEKPVFEIKSKHNSLSEKICHPLSTLTWKDIPVGFPQLNLPAALYPVLVNSYQRSYLQTFDKKFRLTIDHSMQFGAFSKSGLPPQKKLKQAIVLELKYLPENEKHLDEVTEYLPFRLSKNSKYSTGIQLVY